MPKTTHALISSCPVLVARLRQERAESHISLRPSLPCSHRNKPIIHWVTAHTARSDDCRSSRV